jgi:3-demethoxyubiquinol 3-hydroxylase
MNDTRSRLPGDPTQETSVAQMLRVDHAGEYGAARIYAGQLAVLRRSDTAPVLREMQTQEQQHLDRFADLIAQRRVRPTVMLPLWHLAGFALGAATAALGERAAMACTVAVEEVIDEHYGSQAEALDALPPEEADPELKAAVDEFRADELEHRDTGLAHGARELPGYALLTTAIKTGSRLAIWLSTRI